MFELNFDSLWQRFKRECRNRQIKIGIVLSILILSLVGVASYIQIKNGQLAESNKMMVQNRSRYVLKEAMDLIHNGDIYTAQRLCRDLIIHGDTDALIKPEIEKVLYAAEDSMRIYYKQIAIFKGHYTSVEKVRFSPDGNFIASKDFGNKVIVQMSCSGRIICEIDVSGYYGSSGLDFSPNGCDLLIDGEDLALYDFKTGKKKDIIDKDGHAAVFNKTGDKIFYINRGRACLFDCRTGKKSLFEYEGVIKGVFSSVDNSLAIVIMDNLNSYSLYHIDEHGKIICKVLAHRRRVNDIAFSPDGKNIVSASCDGYAKVWNSETGTLISVFKDTHDYVTSVKYDQNGEFVISTGYKNVYFWNPKNGYLIRELKGHNRLTNEADISFDGKYLVSCSHDNTVRLWTLNKEIVKSNFNRLKFCPFDNGNWFPNKDTTILLCEYLNRINIYNIKNGSIQPVPYKGVTKPIFSNGDSCFFSVCLDGYIRKWNVKTGFLVDSFKNDKIASLGLDKYYSFSIRDTNRVYIGYSGKTYVYNHKKNTLRKLFDKQMLYYDNTNDKVCFSDGDGGMMVMTLNGDSLFSLPKGILLKAEFDFSKDGKFLAFSKRYSINVWNVKNREKVFVNSDSKAPIDYCSFSNDGRYLVCKCWLDGTEIRIWDTQSWTCVVTKYLSESVLGRLFWINQDKSLLVGYDDYICRLDLPDYKKMVNNIMDLFSGMDLTDAERDLFFIKR